MSIAAKAADGNLSTSQIIDAFAEIDAEKQRLDALGDPNARASLHRFAADQAEQAKIGAALDRRVAAINILARKRIDAHVGAFVDAGMTEKQAIMAFMEGAGGKYSGVAGGRKSVWALQDGAKGRYQHGLLARIQEERPHIMQLLKSESFDDAVTREMHEIRPDGKPGITGNKDAEWFARLAAEYQELSRTERNRVGGAGIGKLEGRASTQTHDDIKLVAAGKDRWIGFMVGHDLLDVIRSFGAVSSTELTRILGDIYDQIITGVSKKASAGERGVRVGPANLARSLAKHRTLHFKSADAAIMYRKEFGYGGTIAGVFAELGRAGDHLGLFEALGGNPEAMFVSVVEGAKRKVAENPNLTPEQKMLRSQELDATGGDLRAAIDIAMGAINRPVGSGHWAQIGDNIRSVQRMSGLGGVVLTSVPGDAIMTSLAAQYRGSSFLGTFTQHIGSLLQGKPRGEQAVLSYLGAEGADGIISNILGGRVALDSPSGKIAKAQDWFFRANGLTSTTDNARAFNVRMIQAEMGVNAGSKYGELYDAYRHVLSIHGIDEARWDVIRQSAKRQVNGKPYITPDRVRALPDSAFEPLARERLDAVKGADSAERRAAIIEDTRRSLELDLHAFFADEVSYGVVTPDAAAQRVATWGGTRRGTRAGELARYIMQYLSTPIAMMQRPFARTIFGQAKGPKDLAYWGHIGTAISGLLFAGYLSMTLKDAMRGYWPPRNPADPRTIMAAMMQSGAFGIYGDYLFSQVNRFGRSPSENLVGPTIGSAMGLLGIALDARDALVTGGEDKFSAASAFSTVLSNTPFINLWYARAALDYLVLASVREGLSPGFLRKQLKNRQKNYGQTSIPTLIGAKPALDPMGITPSF
jgi:hypothetical protein